MRKVRFLRAFLFAPEFRPVCRSSGVGRQIGVTEVSSAATLGKDG